MSEPVFEETVEKVADEIVEIGDDFEEETEETPKPLICCLVDNGKRCENPIGDGMFVHRCERIEKILNIRYFEGSGHNYLCEKHRAAAFAVMMDENDSDPLEPLPPVFFSETFAINYGMLPKLTIRRYLESRSMRVQLDVTKGQMFYSVTNFVRRSPKIRFYCKKRKLVKNKKVQKQSNSGLFNSIMKKKHLNRKKSFTYDFSRPYARPTKGFVARLPLAALIGQAAKTALMSSFGVSETLKCSVENDGIRCENAAGYAIYVDSKQIEGTQIRLCKEAGHKYLCKEHEKMIHGFPNPNISEDEIDINDGEIEVEVIERDFEPYGTKKTADERPKEYLKSDNNEEHQWSGINDFEKPKNTVSSTNELLLRSPGSKLELHSDRSVQNGKRKNKIHHIGDVAELSIDRSKKKIINSDGKVVVVHNVDFIMPDATSAKSDENAVEAANYLMELAQSHETHNLSLSQYGEAQNTFEIPIKTLLRSTDENDEDFSMVDAASVLMNMSRKSETSLDRISQDFEPEEITDTDLDRKIEPLKIETCIEEGSSPLRCCLNERGIRCTREIGEGMYSRARTNIEESLEINFCSGAGHNYLCDQHKDALHAAIMDDFETDIKEVDVAGNSRSPENDSDEYEETFDGYVSPEFEREVPTFSDSPKVKPIKIKIDPAWRVALVKN